MRLLPLFYTLIFLGSILSSCSTDFDVNADWKETAVVYGLLDPHDSVHYLKINKTFLNENQNANETAQIKDSIYFKDLVVTVNGFEFEPVVATDQPKESGLFYNAQNILFKNKVQFKPDPKQNYKLEIKSPSGKVYRSNTNIVANAGFVAPNIINGFIPRINLTPSIQNFVSWKPGANAVTYDVILRMNYTDSSSENGNMEARHIDFYITKDFQVTSQTLTYTAFYRGTTFFTFVGNTIPVNDKVKRKLKSFDIIYYGADENLQIYTSINKPSLSVVQKKAEFSNIENGLGLFASRNRTVLPNLPGTDSVTLFLRTLPETKALNF